jgi:DNA-binding transcriptional LysR family regulator
MIPYYPVMFDSLFSERGLSLERLRVLIEVHDAGSIARTAPGDEVRHSQYSRQLRELSEFFGCEVTHRRGKLLKLTPEGAQLAELVRPFLRGLEDFNLTCKSERAVFNIAAGDSLIHWLVIPRLGGLLRTLPDVRFTTSSLRTSEIVQQIADARVDFGLIRKNAMGPGMRSAPLGTLAYVAVVPVMLTPRKKTPTFSEVLSKFPFAMQNTDGQFTRQLREIALSVDVAFRPALGCQSFPQTLAAVRSGRFAAIVPELAIQELPHGSVHKVSDSVLRELQRDIILVWNPRVTKVRPHAAKVAAQMQTTLRFS